MPRPNFLIVGAVKSGTSTIRDYLNQHEEIYIAPSAMHFFDKERNFQRGMKWYERQFKTRPQHRAVGEKTPTYCFHRQAPERISQNLPGVKLIWIFRDPVKRAYSNYWHKLRRGGECLGFEAVVEECLKQERAGVPVRSNILERGRYAEQIERYLEFFPPESMMFLLFEEFVRKPTRSLPDVFKFLVDKI
jgi:Sulfotransferase domain